MRTFVCLACCVFIFSAYTHKTSPAFKARSLEKLFALVSDNLFFEKCEVSNGDYKKFLTHLRETNHNDLLVKCLPDSLKWLTAFQVPNTPLSAYYHSHSSYENYPAVAVSYFAANEYCRWLTTQYNSDANRNFKKVVFRLPTENEWMNAANGGDKNKMYPWDMYYLRDKDGKYLCNYKHIGDQSISYDETSKTYKVVNMGILDRSLMPAEVNSFNPNPTGLYNLSGNAAEMVAEEGIAKGGSFNDAGYDVMIARQKHYKAPSVEIGFRAVMQVLEK
jgi:formylglycine-generating enzyme